MIGKIKNNINKEIEKKNKKIMIKSASDYTLFERNVYSKHEPADSRFLKSLKRKLQKITDENKENIVIAPKRKILDFDEIHSKKENVIIYYDCYYLVSRLYSIMLFKNKNSLEKLKIYFTIV